MLALWFSAYALAQSESGTGLDKIVGVSSDSRYLVLEVSEDIYAYKLVGKTRQIIAIDTQSGERKRWLLSSEPGEELEESDIESHAKETAALKALLELPDRAAYDTWAKETGIEATSSGEKCGKSKRRAFTYGIYPDDDRGVSAEWKGDDYQINGMGYLVCGVERAGHLWEHGTSHLSRKNFIFAGGGALASAWTPDCSHIVWIELDTSPFLTRDGYSPSYDRGVIDRAALLPAGPSIAVVGPAPQAEALAAKLRKAGFGASARSDLSVSAQGGPTVYAWSKAEPVAKEIAALAAAKTAPLEIKTSYDVVIALPAK